MNEVYDWKSLFYGAITIKNNEVVGIISANRNSVI